MVRNKLAAAVLAISALQAGLASALGLGEINLNSALNQPLDAEIRLLDTGELDPNQVVIRLASGADFERAGVSRDYFLTNLLFSVEMNGRGGGVIKITTRDPVIEPYLNFLLEARWPSGRLMREYTVLLDLPTFSGASAAGPAPAVVDPTTPGRAGRGTQAADDRGAASSRAAAGPAPAASRGAAGTRMPEASGEDQYRVQHSDTLSEIAARFRPGDASVAQTMLAIQQLNARAFINGNINLVKSGYVLRLPSAEQARGIDSQQAQAEIAAQTRAWRSGATRDEVAGPQLDGRDGDSSAETGPQADARLSIASAGDSQRSAAGEGTGQDSGASTALRDELAASQESLDKSRRENQEMQSRLGDMERQIATLQRLIELKDDQLAALQSQAGAESPADAGAATAADQPVDFNYAENPDGAASSVSSQPAPTAKPASKPADKPGLLAQIASSWLYLGGLVLALVLALVAILVARRRRAEGEADEQGDDEQPFEAQPFDDQEQDQDLALDDDGLVELADDAFEDALSDEQHDAEPAEPSPMSIAATTAAAVAASQPVRAETGDALAEADIYIAYGRYQQAADLLQAAIRAEPERIELRTKLLEVYVESRDKHAFQEQFIALAAMGDKDAVAGVKEHLSSVDGVSGWLDDLPDGNLSGFATAAAAPALDADDVDVDAPLFADDETEDADPDESFDFDLELDALGSGGGLDLEHSGLEYAGDASPAGSNDALTLADDDTRPADDNFDALGLDLESIGSSEPGLPGTGSVLDSEPEALEFTDGSEASEPQQPALEVASADTPALALEDDPELESDASLLDLNLDGDDDFDLALASADPESLADLGLDLQEQDSETGSRDLDRGDMDPTGVGMAESGLSLDGELQADTDDLDVGAADLDFASGDFGSGDLDIDDGDLDLGGLVLDDAGDTEPAPSAAVADSTQVAAGAEDWTVESDPELAPAMDAALEELEFDAGRVQIDAESAALSAESFTAEAMDAEALEAGQGGDQDDDSFDFLGDSDDIATRLDLARAYIDMGDADGARDILQEVVEDGDDAQKQEAEELMERL